MTTGLFSFPATRKAAAFPLELVDGEKLYELALTFVKKEEAKPLEHPERRRAPRLFLSQLLDREALKVALSIPYESSVSKTMRLENISEGGLCALLEHADQLPKFFHLTLRLPTVEDPIRTLGELVWRRQESGSEEHCGIVFLSMSAPDRRNLRRFIESQQTVVVNQRGKENG